MAVLPTPGLADEHRVVLGAARQHLDDAPDLLVAPDDGVELALAGVLGEVAAVLLERLVLLLGVLARDPVAAAHVLERVEHGVVGDAEAAQEVADAAGHLGHREQHVLGGEVVVAEAGALLRRRPRAAGTRRGDELGLLGGLPVDLGQVRRARRRPGRARVLARDADALEHRQDDALGLAEERARAGARASTWLWFCSRARAWAGCEGLARLAGEAVGVERHAATSGLWSRRSAKVDNVRYQVYSPTVQLRRTRTTALLHRHEVAAVLAVDLAPRPRRVAPGLAHRASQALDLGAGVVEAASSSRKRLTPARLTPSLVSSWMRWSSSMSRSE